MTEHLDRPARWRVAWYRLRAASRTAWTLVAIAAFAFSSVLSVTILVTREAERCTQRIERSDEIRAMAIALTVYALDVAGVEEDGQAEIVAGAEAVAEETLPPPDC